MKNKPLTWYGGKHYLSNWIHSLAPKSVLEDPENGYTHRNIVFGGGLGEFWNWEPYEGISETVNDLDKELTNFYEVLASPILSEPFIHELSLTPFSQEVWQQEALNQVCEHSEEIARAKAFFVKYRQSRQGLGRSYHTPTRRVRRGMNEHVSAWLSAVDGLPEAHERLRRVEIRNVDFVEFIETYDHPQALFYLDPPYLSDTRTSKDAYGKYEMTQDDHGRLLNVLSKIEGKFMLSGYHSYLYDSYAEGQRWGFYEKSIDNKASSKKTKDKKTEVVWTNY